MNSYRMLSVACFILLAGTPVASAEPPQATETSTDVGFGFREVLRDEPATIPGGVEEIGHFRLLYYRDQQLSQFDTYSIAPDGRYAVFQDGPSGDLVLFVTKSRNRRVLQKYPGALVRRYTWEKGERTILFEFGARRAPLRTTVE